MIPARAAVVAATLTVALAGGPLEAQDLRRAVAEASGTLTFRFATRPGVEVCGSGSVRIGQRSRVRRWREGWDEDCVAGGAQVRLRVSNGRVSSLDLEPPTAEGGAGDLGMIAGAHAARFLLDLARTGEEEVREEALGAAVLADGAVVWPDLLSMARDRDLHAGVRKSALFWAGQEAADAVIEGLREIASGPDEEQDVRDAAVFALSQRPAAESVPILMDLARTAPQAKTRRAAVFWLAQSRDPRVLEFFEEVLLGRTRGGP